MIHHLTEDQISRWFAGQTNTQEQRHIHDCSACSAEVDHFVALLESFRSVFTERAECLTQRRSPALSTVLGDDAAAIATPPLFGPLEIRSEFRRYRWLSLAVHALVLAALILPSALTSPLPSTETLVALYKNSIPLVFNFPLPGRSSGGGGGGMKSPAPPSRGEPPRAADQQLAPPMVEVRNLAPELVVESTVVAPQTATVHILNVPIGDPNGVVGPPSPGPGRGGGIGTGDGTGVGPGDGPGAGPGASGGGGGPRGNVFAIGGGVSQPVVVYQVRPEYSDDARKARVEGAVELSIIVRPDGGVEIESVQKALGFGLDQKAIEAVRQWRFQPGKKDGQPVATRVSVVVNFLIR
jgi:TonB family protein